MLLSRYLPWAILAAVGGLVGTLWAAGSLTLGQPSQPAAQGEAGNIPTSRHDREKHYVSPRQLADANTMVEQEVRDLDEVARAGGLRGWQELGGGRPLVLVFTKDGCPCSVEFEPFFHRVEQLYREVARFAGVIDASAEAARRYAVSQKVPYPVLPDPGRRIIRRFRAENGGYVVLLTPGGVIDGFWPGCSADTMRDLGRRIARLGGVEERALDVTGMPGPLTTGCPFEP